ncbi:MAG: HEAT repeat domain-containing protein [Candidatus Hinthialibacter antarcticus]|nr:HEAT repeat domain-containing protein [Candidatus Hinthialibacter antarcticus]
MIETLEPYFSAFRNHLNSIALQDQVLLWIIASIGVLFTITLIFAALVVLLRLGNIRSAAKWKKLEAVWEPRVLNYLAEPNGPDELWSRVRKKNRLYFIHYLYRVAMRLSGEERRHLQGLAEPFIELVEINAKRGDSEQRARAVQTLSVLGRPQSLSILINALDDFSPLVAMLAARSLLKTYSADYLPAVLERLHRFEYWGTSFIASMLAGIGQEAVPTLRQCFSDATLPPRSRAVAADALSLLNDFASADETPGVLENEHDRDLLSATLRLVGRVGRPQHLGAIRRMCDVSDQVIRANAIRASRISRR